MSGCGRTNCTASPGDLPGYSNSAAPAPAGTDLSPHPHTRKYRSDAWAAGFLCCGYGRGPGGYGVVDRPDADRLRAGYPPEAGTPEKRLRYYARQFGLVEVDANYYALPAEQTAAAWAARTPAVLHVQREGVQPVHPASHPGGGAAGLLRPAAEKTGRTLGRYLELDPAVADQAGGPCPRSSRSARPGSWAILLQFPPGFRIGRARKEYIVACAANAAPRRVCVQFRMHLDDAGQPGGNPRLPGLRAAPVRVRGHAAGPSGKIHPLGARRHRPRWRWSACTVTRTNGTAGTSTSVSATATAAANWRNGLPDRRAGQGGPGDRRAVQQLLPRLRPGQRPAARRTAQGLRAAGLAGASLMR